MSTTTASASVLTAPAVSLRSQDRGWIDSAPFDLAFFTLSPVLGLLVALLGNHSRLGTLATIAAAYLVGIPHYLSSFTFYMADDDRKYYWSRSGAFIVGPVILFFTVIFLRAFRFHEVVLSAMFLWNIYHVSAQSSGILSLYRRLADGLMQERLLARYSILGVNAGMVFWHIDRFPPVFRAMQSVHPMLPSLIGPAIALVTLPCLLKYLHLLSKRPRLPLPEIVFLAASLLLFHPYLWLTDYNLATLAMLMGHFAQYLAIVWLLYRRKYPEPVGSSAQRLLSQLSHNVPVLLATFFLTGILFYSADWTSHHLGHPLVYVSVWNALTLTHFYLDGLIWQFKRPFIRQSIGPYLALESHRWA